MFDGDLLAERARVTPGKLALVVLETGERLTYAQLNARAEDAACELRQAYRPGDRVPTGQDRQVSQGLVGRQESAADPDPVVHVHDRPHPVDLVGSQVPDVGELQHSKTRTRF